jgi:hypothetical protein
MVQDAAELAAAVWTRIDKDQVNASRNLDDEFASRIATAAYTDTVAAFLDRLSSKMGVRSVDDRFDVKQIVERYDAASNAKPFLKAVRNNGALVVLEMHERLDQFFDDMDGDDDDN